MHKSDQSNVIDQSRRSVSPKTRNARARLEQGEKREEVKASAQSAKQSNTPSRDTTFYQVRASIANYSRQKPISSANRTFTKSETKILSPEPSNQKNK